MRLRVLLFQKSLPDSTWVAEQSKIICFVLLHFFNHPPTHTYPKYAVCFQAKCWKSQKILAGESSTSRRTSIYTRPICFKKHNGEKGNLHLQAGMPASRRFFPFFQGGLGREGLAVFVCQGKPRRSPPPTISQTPAIYSLCVLLNSPAPESLLQPPLPSS